MAVCEYGKLDIMLDNAGISGAHNPRILDSYKENLECVLSIKLTSVFLGMKHAARVMVLARSGTIISTASAVTGTAGSSSKYGVLGLTKNLAVELEQFGTRVNCISPYGLATPMITKYLGPDDVEVEQLMGSVANLNSALYVLGQR